MKVVTDFFSQLSDDVSLVQSVIPLEPEDSAKVHFQSGFLGFEILLNK